MILFIICWLVITLLIDLDYVLAFGLLSCSRVLPY